MHMGASEQQGKLEQLRHYERHHERLYEHAADYGISVRTQCSNAKGA